MKTFLFGHLNKMEMDLVRQVFVLTYRPIRRAPLRKSHYPSSETLLHDLCKLEAMTITSEEWRNFSVYDHYSLNDFHKALQTVKVRMDPGGPAANWADLISSGSWDGRWCYTLPLTIMVIDHHRAVQLRNHREDQVLRIFEQDGHGHSQNRIDGM